MATRSDIISDILDSDLDQDDIQVLSKALKRKLRMIGREISMELEPGTKVKVTSGIKPKYLQGRIGTVVDFPEGGLVEVDFLVALRRYGRKIKMPCSVLKVVSN